MDDNKALLLLPKLPLTEAQKHELFIKTAKALATLENWQDYPKYQAYFHPQVDKEENEVYLFLTWRPKGERLLMTHFKVVERMYYYQHMKEEGQDAMLN